MDGNKNQVNRESGELLQPLQTCPNCNTDFKLSKSERKSGTAHCPECEAYIDYNEVPPTFKPVVEFTYLCDSMNQGDIAILISMLEDAGIEYYTSGQNFSTIDPLIQPARFFVRKDQYEDAREMLKDVDFKVFGVSVRNED